MERYIGCDVHAASCTLSLRNAAGKRLRRDVVETNGEALISYLQGLTGNLHLCLEEGEWSQWLAEAGSEERCGRCGRAVRADPHG